MVDGLNRESGRKIEAVEKAGDIVGYWLSCPDVVH
jgi:hypothetical protein